MTPFAPAPDDLARIDRARAEAWLTAHGWEAQPGLLPPGAGCWWRLRGPVFGGGCWTAMVPADWVGDRARRWRDVLHAVADAHDLRGRALWAVVVAWWPEGEQMEVQP